MVIRTPATTTTITSAKRSNAVTATHADQHIESYTIAITAHVLVRRNAVGSMRDRAAYGCTQTSVVEVNRAGGWA